MVEFDNVSYFKIPTLRCYIAYASSVVRVQSSECWYQDREYNPHHVLILEYFHHPPKKPCVQSLSILTNGFPKIKYLCQVSFIPSFRSGIPTSRRRLGLNVKDTSSRISADEQLHDLGEDSVASRAAVESPCGHAHSSPSMYCCTATSPHNLHLQFAAHLAPSSLPAPAWPSLSSMAPLPFLPNQCFLFQHPSASPISDTHPPPFFPSISSLTSTSTISISYTTPSSSSVASTSCHLPASLHPKPPL